MTDTSPRPEPQASAAPAAPDGGGSFASLFWMAASAVFATGWIIERKQRRLLESEKDSILWADNQPAGPSIMTTTAGVHDVLTDGPNPGAPASAIQVAAIGETTSRREATLIDLHELDGKLARRRNRGETHAAVLLLLQHLVDFRYTSPWVFLELHELYRQLDRRDEWEIARQAFRTRFGQNAPAWETPSTEGETLIDDRQLCEAVVHDWPDREARMFILRWMLGDPRMHQHCSGPPLLTLGVYRDLLALDGLLDEVIHTRTVTGDSLL